MSLFLLAMILTLVSALILHLDDLFCDGLWLVKKAFRRRIRQSEIDHWKSLPQRKIAVVIPCWKTAGHLEQMVRGNLRRQKYENYQIFLGIYEEDEDTQKAARTLIETSNSNKIQILEFRQIQAPTKAALCNEMLRRIYRIDQSSNRYEAFFLTDSDESWNPHTLLYLNAEFDSAPMIQIPVLCERGEKISLSMGTYADELAEVAVKEIPLRAALQSPPPPFCGGIFLQRTLLTTLLSTPTVFSEDLLAEAYQLGRKSSLLGFRVKSESVYLEPSREFLANQKFFPERVASAVEQKSRITFGVTFQNLQNFFPQTLAESYFFWRDRRGSWVTLFLSFSSLLVVLSLFETANATPILPKWLETISFLNFFFWLRRIAFRMYCTSLVYGWKLSLAVPLRWPVGNLINSVSTWRALSYWLRSKQRKNSLPLWTPREKRIPKSFVMDA